MAMSSGGANIEPEIVCGGLGFPEGPIALKDGSVLLVEIAEGLLVRISPDGAKSVVADMGGGPNGAAIGPDGAVYVCNNGGLAFHREPGVTRVIGTPADYSGGRIERVDLQTGTFERLYDSCDGRPLSGPNDLVFDRHGGFYFTDHGKVWEKTVDRGHIYYAKADGSMIRRVIFPISMPNGIALSPNEDTLYVAETETARLWSFKILSPGEVEILPFPSPNGGRIVYGAGGFQRFDSMKVEADGRVCVATLQIGGITTISPADGYAEHTPMPDRNTTNLCFGGPDLKTVYVTLSHSGRLARAAWPRAGHPLNFVDLVG
jgi:gluconolactonase